MALASAAQAASFDCSKATRAVDKLICSDAGLSTADSSLADAYKAALAHAGSDKKRATLRSAQRLWLQKRDAHCLGLAPVAATQCLKGEYAARIVQLPGGPALASAHPVVTMLADGALNAAHPKERSELGFPQGTFSPQGDLFAFAVSQIVSGDNDQVWLYDLASKTLVAATPSPVKDKTNVDIQTIQWVGETLYVEGEHGPTGGAQDSFVRAVTMTTARDVSAMPDAPAPPPPAARDTTAAAGDELSDQGDKRQEDARYEITSKNQGHGALTLMARDKGNNRQWTIATGSWSLADFVFDAPRGRVIFPDIAGIEIYDLASHKTVATIAVPVNQVLAVTADGRLAAFSGNGRCDTSSPAADGGRRQMICFLQLPT